MPWRSTLAIWVSPGRQRTVSMRATRALASEIHGPTSKSAMPP
jgi:hypothetical protein